MIVWQNTRCITTLQTLQGFRIISNGCIPPVTLGIYGYCEKVVGTRMGFGHYRGEQAIQACL